MHSKQCPVGELLGKKQQRDCERELESMSPKEEESYPAESSSAARAAAQPSDTKWWSCMSTLHSLTICSHRSTTFYKHITMMSPLQIEL